MDINDLNNIFQLDITDIDSQGRGVGRLDGHVVFVPFAVQGERVSVFMESIKKNYAIARLTTIEKRSDDRIDSPCHVYGKCGGCTLQHINYKHQLEYKTKLISNQLRRIAGISDIESMPCRPSPNIYNYRNKAVFNFKVTNGIVETGFFEEETHNVVPTDYCYICSERINTAIKIIKEFVNGDKTNISVLQSVTIRELHGNVLINFFLSSLKFANIEKLVDLLKEQFITFGVFLTVGGVQGKRPETRLVAGNPKIRGSICGIDYEASPQTFLQVNSGMAEILYNDALSFVNAEASDIVIDAYSGIGILSALFARKAFHVYGIEIVPQATADAQKIIKRNNIDNVTMLTGDCSLVMPDILSKIRSFHADKKLAVVLDPPRKGCSQEVITALLMYLPDKIIYISCDSATLCRDLKLLYSKYDVISITPYDMFPQTANIETLVYLQKRE